MALTPKREPWLREIDLRADPALAAPLYALMHVQEDLEHYTGGINDEQVWLSPHGLTPLGFHLRHIAGSTRRLTAYLRGEQLTDEMLADLREEKTPGPSRQELLLQVAAAFAEAERTIRSIPASRFGEPRFIGRHRIRTTAIGLAIHIGEHAQRHTGQAITLCHLLRSL